MVAAYATADTGFIVANPIPTEGAGRVDTLGCGAGAKLREIVNH